MSAHRVLVVEDNQALAENLAEILEVLDVDVRLCPTAASALEPEGERPSLAVVDVALPDASGLDVLRELKERYSDVEVVFVTGQGSLATAMEAIALGAFGYLLKPVDVDGFLQLAERALSSVALRRERKRLARALSASEALHRTVVDAIDTGVFGLEASGKILVVNRMGRELLEAELEGEDFTRLFGDPACVKDAIARCCKGERVEAWTEKHRTEKHGEKLIRWSLAHVSAGSPDVVAVGVDITTQESLRKSAAEKEALAAVGVLTAGLAHEIRNPLNAAQLQLQLLLRRTDDDSTKQRVSLVRGELSRLSTLLDEFLGLARQGSGGRTVVEAGELLDAVAALEAPLCERAKIQLHSHAEAFSFEGDGGQLRQALINLVKNAREAIGEGGQIWLEATRSDSEVVLRVRDDGPGVEKHGDAFEPFHTTKAAGTGLGLSIVRKVADAHKGSASLESTETGAIATLRFPG